MYPKDTGPNGLVACATWLRLFVYSYFWLFWVLTAEPRLSLVAESGGNSCCGVRASSGHGFSCGFPALEHMLSSCGTRA